VYAQAMQLARACAALAPTGHNSTVHPVLVNALEHMSRQEGLALVRAFAPPVMHPVLVNALEHMSRQEGLALMRASSASDLGYLTLAAAIETTSDLGQPTPFQAASAHLLPGEDDVLDDVVPQEDDVLGDMGLEWVEALFQAPTWLATRFDDLFKLHGSHLLHGCESSECRRGLDLACFYRLQNEFRGDEELTVKIVDTFASLDLANVQDHTTAFNSIIEGVLLGQHSPARPSSALSDGKGDEGGVGGVAVGSYLKSGDGQPLGQERRVGGGGVGAGGAGGGEGKGEGKDDGKAESSSVAKLTSTTAATTVAATAADCSICYLAIDHTCRRHPCVFLPCGHSSACLVCAERCWGMERKECPLCKAKLTMPPVRLF
jgi:hypothetical protein